MRRFNLFLSFLLAALPAAPLFAACGDAAMPLNRIQGPGDRTPIEGQQVEVEAVVSATFLSPHQWQGFYLLEDSVDRDDDPRTSEGLFVYAPDAKVRLGQRVRLQGRVKEYHGLTELTSVRALRGCGEVESVDLFQLDWNELSIAVLEARESMPFRLSQASIVDLYELGRFGVMTLGPRRPVRPQTLPTHLLQLDDGSRSRDVGLQSLSLKDGPVGRPPRLGDRVGGGRLILDYRYGAWRLQPVEPPRWESRNPRPEPPSAPGPNHLRVAAFNLQNYFNGPDFPTPRGAETHQAFQHQTAKLVSALQALKADVVAVAELENDGHGPKPAGIELVQALGGHWRWLPPPEGRLGDDAIAVGLLYRENRVQVEGAVRVPDRWPAGNRLPLAQKFRPAAGGEPFVVVSVHLKSKRCNATQARSDNGCGTQTRVAAARRMSSWLGAVFPASDVILAGDFNSYAGEPALAALASDGYRRVEAGRSVEDGYTYVYRGLAGSLDHLVLNAAALKRVRSQGIWHINADEWRGLSALSDWGRNHAGPWRSSDHDPVYLDLHIGHSPDE